MCSKGIWYSAGSHTLAGGDAPGQASVCKSYRQLITALLWYCHKLLALERAFGWNSCCSLVVQRDGSQLQAPARCELCTAPCLHPWEKQSPAGRRSGGVGTVSVGVRCGAGQEWCPTCQHHSGKDPCPTDSQGETQMWPRWMEKAMPPWSPAGPLSHTLGQCQDL